jgi:hypothetical protein
MDDYQKWLEAAAQIALDIEYLRGSLQTQDLEQLQIALSVYRKNAESGVPWPSPDDLYCINARPQGNEVRISTEMRQDFRLAC